jgi:predicted nucleic acid-binding protein
MESKTLYLNNNILFTFVRVDSIDLLNRQFNKIVTTPKTYNDLCRSIKMEKRLKPLVENKIIQLKDIKVYSEEFKVFMDLTSSKYVSDNEAMLMAMAKVNNGVILVEDPNEMKEYLDRFQINYISLEDIFVNSIEKGIMSSDEAMELLLKISASKTPISGEILIKIKNRIEDY